MYKINLLPPEKIKHAQNLYLFLYLRIFVELFIVFAAVLSIFLIGAGVVLEKSAAEVIIKTGKITENYQAINEHVRKVNHLLQNTQVVLQAGDQSWSNVFHTLLRTLPADVKLHNISIQRGGEDIEIAGRAKTRAAFSELKTVLGKNPVLGDLKIPIYNIAAKEDIDFKFTAKLKSSPP